MRTRRGDRSHPELQAEEHADADPAPEGRSTPEGPTDIRPRTWWEILRNTVKEAKEDNLTDSAAALTYYSVLALFPALLVFVALVGLFGQYPKTTNALLDIVGKLGPHSAVSTFRGPITGVVKNKGGAGALLGVGLLVAVWSSSSWVGAFMRASNTIYEVREGRKFWKLRPIQIGVTLVMVLMTALVAMAIVVTGPLAQAIGDHIGFGSGAVLVWDIVKWPVLLFVVLTMFGIIYYTAPNVRLPGFRWISPGAVLAVVVWLVASLLFGLYAANFSSYNATYGTLGGVIVFLVWLWLTNLALLLGAEFNAEIERSRELAEGQSDAADTIQLPPRDPPKPRNTGVRSG
ncbi:MAG: ribonuclease [Actinomycetia bacterium]|nr:ribonuclease [Actinomycetes bacterium]